MGELRGAVMNRLCWRLVERASRTLESGEQEAVLGDFAESGESGARALRDVFGLVLRRQAALWWDWRPWLTLVSIVVPIGVLLTLRSAWQARTYAETVHFSMAPPVSAWFLLISWSWSSGFAMATIARRVAGVNGALFCLLLIFGGFWGAMRISARFGGEAAILLLLFQAGLVLLPSLLGMRQALRHAPTSLVLTALWGVAFGAAVATNIWFAVPRPVSWRLLLLPLTEYWPVVYAFATLCRRR